jgi:hypothetical protein
MSKTMFDRARLNPSRVFNRPHDVLANPVLTRAQKRAVLLAWDTDERALQRASNEGMSGGESPRLAEVRQALAALDGPLCGSRPGFSAAGLVDQPDQLVGQRFLGDRVEHPMQLLVEPEIERSLQRGTLARHRFPGLPSLPRAGRNALPGHLAPIPACALHARLCADFDMIIAQLSTSAGQSDGHVPRRAHCARVFRCP